MRRFICKRIQYPDSGMQSTDGFFTVLHLCTWSPDVYMLLTQIDY